MAGREDELLRMSAPSAATVAAFDAEKALGNTAYGERRYRDAITHYTLAEQIDPCSAIAPANRALAHLKLGEFPAANADVTVAIALQDAQPRQAGHEALRVKLLLRRAAARIGLSQYQRAADDYKAALDIEQRADAQAALDSLRDEHGVVPTSPNTNARPRIDVVQEASRVNGNGHASDASISKDAAVPRDATGIVRDFPLMQISDDAFKTLTAKWTSQPPSDALQFERAWKSLRGNSDARRRADYLLLVGARRLRSGLLGHSLTAQQLDEFVVALSSTDLQDTRTRDNVGAILKTFTSVPRFNIAVMLMTSAHKQNTGALVNRLASSGVPAAVVAELRAAFELG